MGGFRACDNMQAVPLEGTPERIRVLGGLLSLTYKTSGWSFNKRQKCEIHAKEDLGKEEVGSCSTALSNLSRIW